MNRTVLFLGMCFFAGLAAAQPRITGIFNNASYARAGLQGSGIAQGSIFAVFGERMGPAVLVQSGFPLATTLEGTSIRVTSGNTGVNAFLIYTSAGQLAAVMPSNAPVGNATAQVTYNGQTSEVFAFNVVARSFGIFSINGGGSGAGVVTGTDFGVIAPNTALQLGGVAILWGTGLGGVLFPDNQAAQVFDLKEQSGIEVFVGNRRANIRYAGRSNCCAGLDQVVFDVPQGITGCSVSVAVRVAGQISNFTTTAIGTGGRRVCSDPGFSDADIERAAASGFQRTGTIALTRTISKVNVPGVGTTEVNVDAGGGGFARFDYRSLVSRGQVNPSPGDCYVNTYGGQGFSDPVRATALDAGTALTVTGPRGTRTLNRVPQVNGTYAGELGGGASIPLPFPIPGVPAGQPAFLDPGEYTVTGPGGADVGPFTAQLRLGAVFNWTNQDGIATVARNTDLQIAWSGGGSEDLVFITGASSRINPAAGASFFCLERASAGRFSVPALVLSSLPPTSNGGVGGLSVALTPGTNLPRFTAGGLDVGFVLYNTTFFKIVGYE